MLINVILPVYNEVNYLATIIQSLHNQYLLPNDQLLITIVNDGSAQPAHNKLVTNIAPSINQLINHPYNQGRSAAINTGCNQSNADIFILLDADCIPQDKNFIQNHLKTLEKSDISCGKLVANSNDHSFWDQYQQDVGERRERDYQNGNLAAFTTANLAMKRQVFIKTNGFDTLYKHYGFEDRDFLLSCQVNGFIIAYSPKAVVSHDARLSLLSIGKKMQDAGQYTSHIFRHKYPAIYQTMSYSKIDLQLHPLMKVIAPLLWLLRSLLTSAIIDKTLNNCYIPYFHKKKIVLLVSALNFMYGTSKQALS